MAAPEDYQALSATLTFNSTVSEVCTPVEVEDDTVFEGNETFAARITTSDAETNLNPDLVTILIADNDG